MGQEVVTVGELRRLIAALDDEDRLEILVDLMQGGHRGNSLLARLQNRIKNGDLLADALRFVGPDLSEEIASFAGPAAFALNQEAYDLAISGRQRALESYVRDGQCGHVARMLKSGGRIALPRRFLEARYPNEHNLYMRFDASTPAPLRRIKLDWSADLSDSMMAYILNVANTPLAARLLVTPNAPNGGVQRLLKIPARVFHSFVHVHAVNGLTINAATSVPSHPFTTLIEKEITIGMDSDVGVVRALAERLGLGTREIPVILKLERLLNEGLDGVRVLILMAALVQGVIYAHTVYADALTNQDYLDNLLVMLMGARPPERIDLPLNFDPSSMSFFQGKRYTVHPTSTYKIVIITA